MDLARAFRCSVEAVELRELPVFALELPLPERSLVGRFPDLELVTFAPVPLDVGLEA